MGLAATCAMVASAAPDNLLRNPGFEAIEDGRPQAWQVTASPGARGAVDPAVRHNGERSGCITGTDPARQPPNTQAFRQVVDLPEGLAGELWLGGWVKADGIRTAWLHVLHRGPAGDVLRNQTLATLEGTFDWRPVAASFTPEQGARRIEVVVGLRTSPGTVWFDDLVLGVLDANPATAGSAAMAPEGPQEAGKAVPVSLRFRLGRDGLTAGGSVAAQWLAWRPAREFSFAAPVVRCALAGAEFELAQATRKASWPPDPEPLLCRATLVRGGPLPAGSEVAIEGELTFARYTNVVAPLSLLITAGPAMPARRVAAVQRLRSVAAAAAQLRCVAEARPLAGQAGRLTVAVTDAHGNPAAAFRGTVRFADAAGSDLPAEYAFTEADAGSHDLAVRWPVDRVSRVRVHADALEALSNPVLPRRGDEPGVYFGDIHSHCEISADGVGDPDEAYDYARRFYGLDFAALSDHSPKGQRWTRSVEVTNRRHAPDRFVTLLGYEASHPQQGHRNLYYAGDDGPEQPFGDTMATFWSWLAEHELPALTVPHHPNTDSGVRLANGELVWGPTDWSVRNDRYQRLVEICQSRGSFEVPGGPRPELRVTQKDRGACVQTALAQGHRLGFIGSTDTHSGRPGNGPARAAVMAPALQRRPIWQALHERHCYATTGAHILVWFTINDEEMGSELTLPATTPREIHWQVAATAPLARVELLRCNAVVAAWEGNGALDMTQKWVTGETIAGGEWWYLRVVQVDREMAWSSPVWVEAK